MISPPQNLGHRACQDCKPFDELWSGLGLHCRCNVPSNGDTLTRPCLCEETGDGMVCACATDRPVQPAPTPPAGTKSRKWVWWLVAGVGILAGAGVWVTLRRKPGRRKRRR
jgi:hypothetical protein